MKTLKHKENGQIRRVENKEADILTSGSSSPWAFAPKSEWKSNRKTNMVDVVDEEQPKRTKASKKQDEKKSRKNK